MKLHTDDDVLEFGDGGNYYIARNTAQIDYTFTELNGDYLPSFALEVTYDKSTLWGIYSGGLRTPTSIGIAGYSQVVR